MATLRNKRKLAAVLKETPEASRSSRAQNVLDPESAQDYISQVSEEIKGRVTKKLSKEFSKTESRILGALSKLDEFLLNPQVRTCSVAVPETSRNNNSENRETTGDRSSDDPYPEVGCFSHHSGQLNSPETENNPHKKSQQKWWRKYQEAWTIGDENRQVWNKLQKCKLLSSKPEQVFDVAIKTSGIPLLNVCKVFH